MPGTRTPYPHSNPSSSTVDAAAGSIHLIGIKTSDTTRASTTTEAQDEDLTVTVLTGRKYLVNIEVFGNDLTIADGGGFNLSLGGTAAFDNICLFSEIYGDGAVSLASLVKSIGAIGSIVTTDTVNIRIRGSIRCTMGGTLFVKWAQFVSLATGFKVYAGSYIDLTDIG